MQLLCCVVHKFASVTVEKFVDKFDGNSKYLRSLFRIPQANKFEENLFDTPYFSHFGSRKKNDLHNCKHLMNVAYL